MSDTVAAAAPLLAQQGLVELLELVKDADSVELKLSVDASRQRSAVEALGLDPLEAQVRLKCAPSEAFQVADGARARRCRSSQTS